MRFNFRKIASAAASIAMMGSTIGLAAAANYPAPFVTEGAGNVAIVYGSGAASSDLVAAIDITASLQSFVTADGTTGTTTIEGEATALFGGGNNKIYHNDSINKERDTVTDTDLPTLLADTDFDGDVSADLTHTINIGSFPKLAYSQQPTSDDDPTWNIEMSTTPSTSALYNATVSFDKAVNFTLPASETEDITIFGQKFTVGSATDATDLVLFRAAETVFLNSETNPSESVTIEDETYTIELVSASDSSATIRVTDSTGDVDQKEINEGSSKRFLGKIEVAVNNADETNFALSAEVNVGADKVKMSDGNEVLFGTDEIALDGTRVVFTGGTYGMTQLSIAVTESESDEDAILPGGSFVDPVFGTFKIEFTGLANDDDREIIKIRTASDDKMTLSMTDHNNDEKLSLDWAFNNSQTDFGEDVVIASFALADSGGDLIHVRERAQVNDSHYIVLGNEDEGVLLELTSVTNSSNGFGSDSVTFKNVFSGTSKTYSATSEGVVANVVIEGNSYTINYFGASGSAADSRYVRINDPDSTGEGMNLYNTIQTSNGAKVAFYQPIQINLNNWRGGGVGTNVTSFEFPDGDKYTSISVTRPILNNFSWTFGTGGSVNLSLTTSGTTITVGQLTYNVTGGGGFSTNAGTANDTARIYLLPPEGGTHIDKPALIIFEEEDDNNNYEVMVVRLEGDGTDAAGIGVTDVDRTNIGSVANFITHEVDNDLSSVATLWGSVITLDDSESDQQTAEISYPDEQVYAEVYVAEVGASITGGTATPGGTLGSVTVMDSEVSQVSSKNLVVIGGSCINTVAASLLGSDTPMCGSAWTAATGAGAGQYLVQTFDGLTSGKVATLVAGTEASDTTNAATYFRTQSPQTNVGDKYLGTSATSAELETTETTE